MRVKEIWERIYIEKYIKLKNGNFLGGKKFSQGILLIFSLQVSSKLSRLSIISCHHVANYVSIVLAQR